MDWYCRCGSNDFLVPEDEDLLDWHPSPDRQSKWGISAPEGFYSPKEFFIMDANATEAESNMIDEKFNNEIELESSLLDKDQSSNSSACGGLLEQSFQQPAFSSHDQPNYQLQDLSRFEQMDDIFLASILEDLPCVENLHKSIYFDTESENQCSNTQGGLQKDIAASIVFPCSSTYEDFLDKEASIVKVLDCSEQCNRDEDMHEQSSLEESILQDLDIVISQFTEKTRIWFRDALYRLARNTETKQVDIVEDQDGGLDMLQEIHNEIVRSEDYKPKESESNCVDRAVANLMFNKMEINMQDLPFVSVNSQHEGKGVQGKSSNALNLEQKFHYHHRQNSLGDAEVPVLEQRDQQTDTKSHIAFADPEKQSFML